MNPRDLFISHSSEDAEVARALRAELEAAGYTCWMAPDDIVGTETWTEQILSAIGSSKAMLVLVSTAANKSPHVSREVNLALGRGRAVLPIRIEPVPPEGSLEYLLSLVQRVDAFPPPISSHRDEILRRLSTIAELPAPATGPTKRPSRKGASAAKASRPERASTKAPPPPEPGRRTQPIGPGSVVGGFTIEAVLGEGGMATVYRARQAEPNRAVALKVIRADHSHDPSYRQRFLAEKDTLASLEHPGIVPIYAAGDDDGLLYIAMRLIDGADLGTRIEAQGRLGIRETAQVLRPIADAIDYAHEMGVVHRDLKPANILLDRSGRPYLTDIAIGDRGNDAASAVTGIVMGTAAYMAPEQAAGRPDSEIGPAIDIYALGCIAYACLAGHPPFVRDTPEAVLAAHVGETPPSLRAERADMPKVLDELLAKALAKDPAARFATASELVAGLELVAQAATAGATQPVVLPETRTPTAKARRWIGMNQSTAVIGAALGAIVLVVGAASVLNPDPSKTPAPTTPAATQTGPGAGPSGGTIAIDGEGPVDGVTTNLLVKVDVLTDPTSTAAITKYVVANTPVRPPTADGLDYTAQFPWNLDAGNGKAGERSVYVWFGNANGAWSSIPIQASVVFDNPPTVQPEWLYDRTGTLWCDSLSNEITIPLVGDATTDPDGNDKLTITRAWTGGATFPGTLDLSDRISDDRTSLAIPITLKTTGPAEVVDWYTAQDAQGLTVDGSFSISLGYEGTCP